MRTIWTFALLLFSLGCGPTPTMEMGSEKFLETRLTGRFAVQRVGVFSDDLAYGNRRGIYLITDSETGAQFVGVSGVGISELGSHTTRSGKTTVTVDDER